MAGLLGGCLAAWHLAVCLPGLLPQLIFKVALVGFADKSEQSQELALVLYPNLVSATASSACVLGGVLRSPAVHPPPAPTVLAPAPDLLLVHSKQLQFFPVSTVP